MKPRGYENDDKGKKEGNYIGVGYGWCCGMIRKTYHFVNCC